MNVQQLQQQIRDYAAYIGIDKIGFASADPFVELKQRLIRHRELGYESGFEEKDLDKRTTPTLLLPGAQSIIAIAVAYPSKMNDSPKSARGERRGLFCRASWGTDYHLVLKDMLTELEAFILTLVPEAKLKSMVDTGELSDRAVSERAGIGWSGKNTMIITEEFGSYVYLGEMITNIPFIPDTPMEDQCGECRLCMDVCPTGALVQPGQLNAQRCIAFLTQTKNPVPLEFRDKIGNRIYGCDTCQTVCPKNRKKYNQHQKAFEPDGELVKPLLKPLLRLSNRQFKERFGHMSGSWRGKNPIQRNALIALAHFKDETALPDIHRILQEDVRPMMRGTAAWATAKILHDSSIAILESCLQNEEEESVRLEIEAALTQFKEKEENANG
ncbi:tRNA epoxyqueuosine(34) reductase QueG [Savagea sp. SN6]|uniref:tRNA epoxyqueuosine(34) reductase QueG n=1 Tax=Savagea serpentis TaxID=2785297 RepID=A0A8J7G496_9BACL|nr:tRNA epoxyqueuosine(34) reductase QueG [Savagea serpentis]MBF4501970.1 tRNA epoxyqueuosine(34) reductase QueG [Savagea serpentis]